jgi:hypothetical protein
MTPAVSEPAALSPEAIQYLSSLPHPASREQAEKYLAAGNYETYLVLFGSEDRWYPLWELFRMTQIAPFGLALNFCCTSLPSLFQDVWTMAKNLPPEKVITRLISSMCCGCPKAFREEAQTTYDALPKRVTLYRGFRGPNRASRSWSLSEAVARDFAERVQGYQSASGQFLKSEGTPTITTLTVSKSQQVLFYTNDREEQEVVLRKAKVGAILMK